MLQRCAVLMLVLIAGLAAHTQASEVGEPLTGWEKTKLVAFYPLAIHQLPLTTAHEGSHWLVSQAFGGKPHMRLLPSYVEEGDTKRLGAATIYHTEELTTTQSSLVLIAPYVVQLAVVDRLTESAYRHNKIPIDSLGDKYIQAVLSINMGIPFDNMLTRKHDIGKLADNLHVNRFVLGAVIQAAYIASYSRIMKVRGRNDSAWALYFHGSF